VNLPPDDLERELRQWQPAPLPEPLAERLLAARAGIEAAGGRKPGRLPPISSRLLTLGMFAAALAFAALAFFHTHRSLEREAAPPADLAPEIAANLPAAAAARYQPVGWTNTILSAADEGIVHHDVRGPARRIRYESVETFQFRDPKTGAVIEIDVPREEVVFVGLDPI